MALTGVATQGAHAAKVKVPTGESVVVEVPQIEAPEVEKAPKAPKAPKPPKAPKDEKPGKPLQVPVPTVQPPVIQQPAVQLPVVAPLQSLAPTLPGAAPAPGGADSQTPSPRPTERRRGADGGSGVIGPGEDRVRGRGAGGAGSSGRVAKESLARAAAQGLQVAAEREPVPASRRAKPEGESDGDASNQDRDRLPVIGTVGDIVEVVPEAIKVLLGALAALTIVLGGSYLAIAARARGLARQRADLLKDVGLLQTALLPPVPATMGGLRTSVAYRPSDGPGAGGDFYDALALPGGRAAFILGDVSGHGRQALARTAFMRYTLRAYLEAGLEPRASLQVAGRVVGEHLDGHFVTVVVAVHDPAGGTLTYACAGHPAPIVVGPTRPEPVLAASSPPIGLDLRTGVRQTTVPLPPGSVVCLYTDGLAEARTQRGILGRPRLADIVEGLGRHATAAGLLDAIAEEARLVTDDMATLVLTPTAGVTTGGFRCEQLEVNAEEAAGGLAERFLTACEVPADRIPEAVAEARALASAQGATVLYVRFGTVGSQVEVLPHNVTSLEAAARLRAVPRRSSA